MAEYIDCRSCNSPDCRGCNINALAKMLNAGKFDRLMNANRSIKLAADVVEVVRCKDCKWLCRIIEAEGYWICNQRVVREDDFCSYGMRKENSND